MLTEPFAWPTGLGAFPAFSPMNHLFSPHPRILFSPLIPVEGDFPHSQAWNGDPSVQPPGLTLDLFPLGHLGLLPLSQGGPAHHLLSLACH